VAKYDKYDSKMSGTRAFLAADWLAADLNKVVGVGLNNAGRIVKGAGATGIIGVLILTRIVKAGREPVDPMKRGEIVEFDVAGIPAAPLALAAPGIKVYVNATTGAVQAAATGGIYVGHTVEKGRLVVSVDEGAAVGA